MLPRRVASSGIRDVLHSPSTGLRSEASTIPLPLRTNRGAIHHCNSCTASQRTHVGNPDSLAQACSTLAKAMVFCCLITWEVRGSWGRHVVLWGEGQGLQVEGPTILLLPVGPAVARMPLPANKPSKGPWVHWGSCEGCERTLSSGHRASGFSTSVYGGSSTFLHGSTCRGGSLDLVPLASTGVG